MRTLNESPSNPNWYINVNKFRESFNIIHGSTKLRNLLNLITIIMFKLILFNEMRVNIIGNELSLDIRIKCNVPQKDNYNSDIRLSRVISEPLNQIRRGAQKNKNKQENATDVQKLIIIILNMLFILLISIRISQNIINRVALLLIKC